VRVLVIDNYDSFTYNLVQYLGELGAEVLVRRNDKITSREVLELHPDRIVLSPGPCTPGEPVHGKTARVWHDGEGVYRGLEQGFEATRYHSLVIEPDSVPECLVVSSRTEDGVIMGVRHREYPVEGIQFHPESVLTMSGRRLLENFLRP
jgi:anthranilate synthase component 2